MRDATLRCALVILQKDRDEQKVVSQNTHEGAYLQCSSLVPCFQQTTQLVCIRHLRGEVSASFYKLTTSLFLLAAHLDSFADYGTECNRIVNVSEYPRHPNSEIYLLGGIRSSLRPFQDSCEGEAVHVLVVLLRRDSFSVHASLSRSLSNKLNKMIDERPVDTDSGAYNCSNSSSHDELPLVVLT